MNKSCRAFSGIPIDQAQEQNNKCVKGDGGARKGRSIENIPPTYGALVEHTKRVAYQAGYCWGQSLTPDPTLPSPAEWGWTRSANGPWQPNWTMLPEASKAIHQLIKCGCKLTNGCRGHCKCVKAELKSTSLCSCNGDFERDIVILMQCHAVILLPTVVQILFFTLTNAKMDVIHQNIY